MSNGRLLVLPALDAYVDADGHAHATRKFVDGAQAYARAWPGPVTVVLQPTSRPSNNLDNVRIAPAALDFDFRVMSHRDERLHDLVREAAVVLSAADYRQHHLVDWCRDAGVPIVLNTELTLRTRWQIARSEGLSVPRLLRRLQWEAAEELRLRRSIRRAAGLQCAGTPTYEAYRHLNPRTLLYFDSRNQADRVVAEDRLEARLSELLRADSPLRMAFSGRLVSIKGVDQIPRLCRLLADRGVRFEFRLFGDGPLRAELEREAQRLGLDGLLRIEGAVDYATQLVPAIASSVDLFVCPHVQGDPSCTYIETLACGVPIVGYANEMWTGMLRSGVEGWVVPSRDVRALADQVAMLDKDRTRIVQAARAARAFAAQHTFERVFATRVEHLRGAVRPERTESAVGRRAPAA
jgi:glycosyltransferase involved in cell wall biosynthesis